MSKSAYSGVAKLRRLLRKMDPETVKGVTDAMKRGAESIHYDMLSSVPQDSGDLARSIGTKKGRDGMTYYIGPGADRASVVKLGFGQADQKYTKSGALTKATISNNDARFQLYKANWIEFGTKPHGGHPGTPARPFLNPAYDANSRRIMSEVQNAIAKALESAANG